MTVTDLKKELDKGKKRNFYVFTGEEGGMINLYINKIGSKVVRVNKLADIMPKLTSPTLFGRTNTYVVTSDKDLLEVEGGWDKILKLIGKNTVILVYPTIDKRSKFYKAMDKHIFEFNKLTEKALVGQIVKLLDVSDKIAMAIARSCNCDYNRVLLEVDKLSRLPEVTMNIIEEVIVPLPEDVIFDMVGAILKSDIDLTYAYYSDLKQRGESPIKIISIMYTNFKNVMLVQAQSDKEDRHICASSGLTPWQVKMTRDKINYFDLNTLIKILRLVQGAEEGIKMGRIEQEVAMEKLIADVLLLGDYYGEV